LLVWHWDWQVTEFDDAPPARLFDARPDMTEPLEPELAAGPPDPPPRLPPLTPGLGPTATWEFPVVGTVLPPAPIGVAPRLDDGRA
jgi:hypothetical protein